MTKKVISQAILRHADIRVRDADVLAGHVVEALRDSIVADGSLKLPGVGTFIVVRRASRQGLNPKTKQPYHSPERRAVRFKASPALVVQVNSPPGAADVEGQR